MGRSSASLPANLDNPEGRVYYEHVHNAVRRTAGRISPGGTGLPKNIRRDPAAARGRRPALRRILIPLLILAVLSGACAWYLNSYYPADEAAAAVFSRDLAAEERVLENGDLVFGTGREACGWIFYPGGKVAEDAYAPLMRYLASKGVFCVICKMPFRLAVLDGNAADGIREAYPGVRRWYLGGHSLGGVMAASYLADHPEGFEGLILLASYSTEDLSGSGLAVLSVVGSEDGVLDRDAWEKNRTNLPAGAAELEIEGGCHAGFGMYGPQRGDGTPAVSAGEQIRLTAEAVLTFMEERGE